MQITFKDVKEVGGGNTGEGLSLLEIKAWKMLPHCIENFNRQSMAWEESTKITKMWSLPPEQLMIRWERQSRHSTDDTHCTNIHTHTHTHTHTYRKGVAVKCEVRASEGMQPPGGICRSLSSAQLAGTV